MRQKRQLRLISLFVILPLLLGAVPSQSVHADVADALIQPEIVPEGLTSTQWKAIQDIISADQYAFEQVGALAAAANHTQGWDLTFGENGLRVMPQNDEQSWQWGLTLTGYGYERNIGNLDGFQNLPGLTTDANTLTNHWDENISEWWINDPTGLEQGFTIQARPPAHRTSHSSPLVLEMAVTGNLIPVHDSSGDGIHFQDEGGATILTYDKLLVTDATDKVIPAQFKIQHSLFRIQILVEDANAVYPLTIDPWVQIAKLTASDGAAGDNFGQSVAIVGDTLVVGASGGKGSAYVFIEPSVGGWATTSSYVAKLTASDGADGDDFGFSVSISGDTIVVGAYQDDDGSAYVFVKPGGAWKDMTETAKLTAEGSRSLNFGISVAISGDTVVAGANWAGSASTGNFGQGAAYVFVKPSSGWATTNAFDAKLTASDGVGGYLNEDHFGRSVAISGNTIVVGTDSDDIGGNKDQGSAYVFVKPGSGWSDMTETAKLTTSADAKRYLIFGASVAIDGDTIVVGAPGYEASRGSAYIYVKPGSGWTTTDAYNARLTAAGGTGPDEFGESVSISGDKIVVGAYQDDSWPNTRGSAFLFEKPGGGWATTSVYEAKLTASDRGVGDRFGYAVGVSGDTVVVGAYQDDVDGNKDQGSAYAFEYREIDLGAVKTNSVGGAGSVGTAFDWTVTISNTGVGNAVFNDGKTIFKDDLTAGPVYGAPAAQNFAAITNSANIDCEILGTTLTCTAKGANVTIGANTGSFDVVFSATPNAGGDIANPTTGGVCKVDPDYLLLEIEETNNNCSDTVTVPKEAVAGGVSMDREKSCSLNSMGATCIDGLIKVRVAANTITDDQACQIIIEETNGGNFELDGRAFDIKVICDSAEKHTFQPAINICIKPTNAQLQAAGWNFNNLIMHHNHAGNGWQALGDTFAEDGYLCARLDQLSLFTLTVPGAPATGFPVGMATDLQGQPAFKAYSTMDDFRLEIPALGVELPIVGVPLTIDGWDVTWLDDQVGYLAGTAFPTWVGNTALTAHVWNADNTPGPFVDLHTLKHGDQIIIQAWGQEYVYEVRATQEVRPDDLSFLPNSEYDTLTLITCQGYNEVSGEYDLRLAVRAVLITIE